MENTSRKQHWENIYQTKELSEVSWYQPTPITSLEFLQQLNIPTNAKIIDIGGGDSFFADHLLALGYSDISVLDISEAALEKAKKRLGNNAAKIKWIVADAAHFKPTEQYDFWHDRAAFHFLTQEEEIKNYIHTISKAVKRNGIVVIGTFSENGPKKCSGIEIKQYNETSLTNLLKDDFEKINCINVDHKTPFDTVQNFIFCSFRKR
ncbi:MAG: class I SAM-dependent methyltransferase [Bacteroidota bacterium]|nr:class I SAM-dependent methyltransferase [Bacteroidota bacterium]